MSSERTRVFLASPYAGDIEANVAYARRCLKDSLDRGESPFAPHLTHPGVLDDAIPAERQTGLDAGKAWLEVAEKVVAYIDRGESSGMIGEMIEAVRIGIPIERRRLD